MTGDAQTQLNGTVEDVVYRNAQNDYSVIELATDDGLLVNVVGILPGVAEGEVLSLQGRWVTHASYGKQFAAESFEKRLPSDVHAILRYLSSGAVRGIGPSTAAKIVQRYGADSFTVIEEHPEWLSDIPGISKKKAAAIGASFQEQAGVRAVMTFCQGYFGAEVAARVYRKWGNGAVSLIREDPYRLCEIAGISFDKADEMAASFGVEKNAGVRLQSGLQYLLQYNADMNGHACLPREKLVALAVHRLEVDEPSVQSTLSLCLEHGLLVELVFPQEEPSGIVERRMIYTADNAADEAYVAQRLLALDRQSADYTADDIDLLIARIEGEQHITYARLQRAAIHAALTGGVLALTGGPGTGKTTVILALKRIFEALGDHVALAAPTGRAAKRMSEATAHEARTIHRMLEMERREGESITFNRNRQNPLDENVIIIDEASMLDLPLMAALLRAMKNGARLILIGDADQLPPVGTGNVFADLLASGVFRTVYLTEIFRQSEESLIVTNAHRIDQGEMPILDARQGDFFFVERNREDMIAPTVADLLCHRLPRAYGEEVRGQIQVITPSRKGRAGTEALNLLLQEQLNPPAEGKKELRARGRIFREGDRVMQIRNDYEILWEKNGVTGNGVFNGDIGVITEIRPAEEILYIRYDDRLARYEYGMLEELEHAYAITVHKSQGSEYPVVLIPLYACAPQLLTRNLIYTAVTRARRMVVLVGVREIAARMIQNDRHDKRYTGLVERLRACRPEDAL